MKKTLLFIFLFTFICGFAQEDSSYSELKNEIHINAFLPIVLRSFELSYERNLNKESSVGLSGTVLSQKYFDTEFTFSPYYRKYFSKGYAKGFFMEGYTSINSSKGYVYTQDSQDEKVSKTNLALGVGLGVKLVAKDNFVGIFNLGIARNLFDDFNPKLLMRGGISFGYRF